MDDMSEFEKFLKDWDPTLDNASTSYKPVYHKPKKQSNFIPRGDGHGMIDDLDKYMTSEPGRGVDGEISDHKDYVPRNIWDFLKNKGYDREVVKYINVSYDNVKCVVDKLDVVLITGDKLNFSNIELRG